MSKFLKTIHTSNITKKILFVFFLSYSKHSKEIEKINKMFKEKLKILEDKNKQLLGENKKLKNVNKNLRDTLHKQPALKTKREKRLQKKK